MHEGNPEDFPNTEAYFRECLSLPIHPSLTDKEQTEVIQAIKDVV
jgi:dTDP-4-amino-4,6-dideoxygalactose transaminase